MDDRQDLTLIWTTTCQHCGRSWPEGSEEAEFISWHGHCAHCELAQDEQQREEWQ